MRSIRKAHHQKEYGITTLMTPSSGCQPGVCFGPPADSFDFALANVGQTLVSVSFRPALNHNPLGNRGEDGSNEYPPLPVLVVLDVIVHVVPIACLQC